MNDKPIEIFCGTGGVGKTTLATSRAVYLATKNKRVLLITIDPARRLKQILHLQEQDAGSVKKVNLSTLSSKLDGRQSIDALLMGPSQTLGRMAKNTSTEKEMSNKIIEILSRPHGGMNEILSTIEVQYHLESNNYDTIILDTPPGKNFLDFLDASHKIHNFFDASFIEIFKFLGKNFESDTSKTKKVLGLLVGSGIKKLLHYLQKVTGPEFVHTFVDAVAAIYKNKDQFLKALDFQENLSKKSFSNWFLVTSAEHNKAKEAFSLRHDAGDFFHNDTFLVINKSLKIFLEEWALEEESPLAFVKKTMLDKENRLKHMARNNFTNTLLFPEILGTSPEEHVLSLAKQWEDQEI